MKPHTERGSAVALTITCAVALLLLGVMALFKLPDWLAEMHDAKRGEVVSNVEGIKTAMVAYEAESLDFVALPAWPRPPEATDEEKMPWSAHPAWDAVGWAPDGPVHGSYWVERSEDGTDFTVFGVQDIDGDGAKAWYTATKSIHSVFLNNSDIY